MNILTDEEWYAIQSNLQYGEGGFTPEKFARTIESAVINKLATVEGGPVAFRRFKNGKFWEFSESAWLDACAPDQEPLHTATQLAAHRARDAAEIERLEGSETGLNKYITKVQAERDAQQARVSELEVDAGQILNALRAVGLCVIKTNRGFEVNWLSEIVAREARAKEAR